MGLKSVEALRAFCLELSSNQPSPGGGTASAASSAMAASLLVMVCDITSRSKKHEGDRPELLRLRDALVSKRDELISLSAEDARAYDMVIDAIRRKKAKPGEAAEQDFQTALRSAAQVPMSTAAASMSILECSVRIAEIGIRSASSDVGVAVTLAEAGLNGAVMNVLINLQEVADQDYSVSLTENTAVLRKRAEKMASKALSMLDRP